MKRKKKLPQRQKHRRHRRRILYYASAATKTHSENVEGKISLTHTHTHTRPVLTLYTLPRLIPTAGGTNHICAYTRQHHTHTHTHPRSNESCSSKYIIISSIGVCIYTVRAVCAHTLSSPVITPPPPRRS